MTGLLGVRSVEVPMREALHAHSHLQDVGKKGLEGFALWAGVVHGAVFHVRSAIIPAQTGMRARGQVCVTVSAEELHRINVWLFNQGFTLIAQLHSHPTEAFHSDTDNAFPIATAVGSLSIVVPNFGAGKFALSRCAVYRLTFDGRWKQLSSADVSRLIIIVA